MITLDANHVYHDAGGQVVPGVTGILKGAGLIDDRFFDEYSRDRGSLVHQACAMYDRDDLDMDTLDPVLAPYVSGWIKFRKESGFVPALIESIVFNEQYFYAGTLDRTGNMNGQEYILDIKSGAAQPWTAAQLAAYSACLWSNGRKRGAVELRDDGTYKLTEYKDRNDLQIFLSALAIVNWKRNNKIGER
ncbi:MAG: hypothetical protein M0R00_09695 [Candidatus Omnitrophica bacterium]|jgi:hypothetical protein|nr:hypothetical protein [Candidatus Omnitrophota bacterium]